MSLHAVDSRLSRARAHGKSVQETLALREEISAVYLGRQMTLREISEAAGVSLNAVRMRAARARKEGEHLDVALARPFRKPRQVVENRSTKEIAATIGISEASARYLKDKANAAGCRAEDLKLRKKRSPRSAVAANCGYCSKPVSRLAVELEKYASSYCDRECQRLAQCSSVVRIAGQDFSASDLAEAMGMEEGSLRRRMATGCSFEALVRRRRSNAWAPF